MSRALAALGRGAQRFHPGRLRDLAMRANRTGIVVFSIAITASLVASVMSGPIGSHVLAHDGYGKRDRDAGVIAAVLFGSDTTSAHRAGRGGSWSPDRQRSRWVQTAAYTPIRRQPDMSVRWRSSHRSLIASHHRAPTEQLADTLPTHAGHNAVCVRLCDGYFFPMGDINAQGDVDSRTSLCAGLCPGAPTRLFVTRGGSDPMSQATAISTGETYAALPVAFAHTKEVGPTCTCRPGGEEQATIVSPLTDFTMRSGDSVMTPAGWRVFQGANHWPYRRNDFTPIRSARNLSPGLRSTLVKIEDASLGRRVASRARPLSITQRQHLAAAAIVDRTVDGSPIRQIGQEILGAP